jgi:hypothetical protein
LVAAEYVEPGNTATDDRRPAFQSMIDAAMMKLPAFTVIVVHSFSRFFRDQFQFEFYVRKLAKNGVKLISITQDLGDDPMSVMMRQITPSISSWMCRPSSLRRSSMPPEVTKSPEPKDDGAALRQRPDTVDRDLFLRLLRRRDDAAYRPERVRD